MSKRWSPTIHCVKSVQIQSFFWSVFSCIRTEHRKIRTRRKSVFEHFSRSNYEWNIKNIIVIIIIIIIIIIVTIIILLIIIIIIIIIIIVIIIILKYARVADVLYSLRLCIWMQKKNFRLYKHLAFLSLFSLPTYSSYCQCVVFSLFLSTNYFFFQHLS